jgi:DNA-binding MarR family transcriptional regulator
MTSTSRAQEHDPAVLESLDELSSLLGETVRALKHSYPPPQQLREAVERGSLGPRHLPALLVLARAEPLSVSELANRLGLELSSTSSIVGGLSRAGLLRRAEDDADRRRTIVSLHDDYRPLIVAWAEQALSPLRSTLERLTPSARESFLEGWRILHEEATRNAPAEIEP